MAQETAKQLLRGWRAEGREARLADAQLALDFGHHKLVQWLLDRGANANARSSFGSRGTALHSAA
jgi:Ankyrin repeats (many copies)